MTKTSEQNFNRIASMNNLCYSVCMQLAIQGLEIISTSVYLVKSGEALDIVFRNDGRVIEEVIEIAPEGVKLEHKIIDQGSTVKVTARRTI